MNPDKLHLEPYVFVLEWSEDQKNVGKVHARGSAPERSEGQRLVFIRKWLKCIKYETSVCEQSDLQDILLETNCNVTKGDVCPNTNYQVSQAQ